MYSIDSQLIEVPLMQLRPTQMTVGYREVEAKRRSWAKLGSRRRREAMSQELFPAVKGPQDTFYILDHHHTALALVHEEAQHVQVGLAKDLSELSPESFWTFLDHYSWVHPYDARGRRRPFKNMPQQFEDLRDDPYRSLAGEVRDAGGFAKADEPFLEFLWANYFRTCVPEGLAKPGSKKALDKALSLAASSHTAHLPGWSGAK